MSFGPSSRCRDELSADETWTAGLRALPLKCDEAVCGSTLFGCGPGAVARRV